MRLAYIKEIKNTHLLTLGLDGDGESVRFTVSASVYAPTVHLLSRQRHSRVAECG